MLTPLRGRRSPFSLEQVSMDLAERGRLLYVSSVDVSRGDGPGVNEREFIIALHEALGDRAHFLLPLPAGPVPDLPRRACTFAYPHRRHKPLPYLLHQLSVARQANRALRRRAYDLVVMRLDVLPLASWYISRHAPYAIKTLGQGEIHALARQGGVLGRALAPLDRRLMSLLVKSSIVADACSSAMVEHLQQTLSLDQGQLVWIDNAVNVDRFCPVDRDAARCRLELTRFDPIVGYVGSLPWERGAQHLVEIAPKLLARHPRLGVVIVGDGSGVEELRLRARELGVEDHCVFTGYVPLDHVPLWVNALDVGVSISDRHERFAAAELKVRQYVACGKPVVASPGSNEFLSENGLGSIVDARDPASIEAELERWLSMTPGHRDAFARRAREYASEKLSEAASLRQRLATWSDRLSAQSTRKIATEESMDRAAHG